MINIKYQIILVQLVVSVISSFSHKAPFLGKGVPGIQIVGGKYKNCERKSRKSEGEDPFQKSTPPCTPPPPSVFSPAIFCTALSNLQNGWTSLLNRMVISFVVLLLLVLFATSQLRNNKINLSISQVCSNLVSRYYVWVVKRVHAKFTIVNFHADQRFI